MFFEITKRIIDIVASLVLIIIFSPVMLATAIIVKVTSPGPILVEKSNLHMIRKGKNGKLFRLYKFRSMIVNSDSLITKDPKYKKLYEEWKNTNF